MKSPNSHIPPTMLHETSDKYILFSSPYLPIAITPNIDKHWKFTHPSTLTIHHQLINQILKLSCSDKKQLL